MIIPLVQEKDRDKKEKEKEGKEKDKKVVNGHLFTAVGSGQATHCFQCNKAFNNKEAYHCSREYLCLFFFFYAFFPLQWSGLLLLSSNQLSVLWSIIEIIVDLREKGSSSEICPKMITSSDKEVASTLWRGSVRTFEPCDYDAMYIIDKIVFIYFIYLSAAHNIESKF